MPEKTMIQSSITPLTVKDQALKSVARGAGIFFIGIILGRFLGYLIRMVIARFLGPESYGLISLAISVVEIAATLALFGLPTAINRYVPFFWSARKQAKVRGVIRSAFRISLPAAIITALALLFFSGGLSNNVFSKPDLAPILRLFAVIVPFYSLMMICSAIFAGFKKMEYIVYTQQFVRYIFILALFIILFMLGLEIKAAAFAYPLGYLFTAGFGLYLAQKTFPIFGKNLESVSSYRKLFSFSWPLILVSMIWFIIDRVATIMLGYFKSAEIVGIYNAALPLAQLIPAVLQSFTTIFMPIISSILSTGDFKELNRIYAITTKWIMGLTLPLFVVIFLFAKTLTVKLFGVEYAEAAPALQILTLGFFFHSAVGPTTMTLNALERTRLTLINTVAAFSVNIILHFLLIPKYGLIGAALASALALVVLNLLTLIELFFIYSIQPFNRKYLKTLLAGSLAAGIVYFISMFFSVGLLVVLLLAIIFIFFYGCLALLLRVFEPEDRDIIQQFQMKLGIRIKLPQFIKSRMS